MNNVASGIIFVGFGSLVSLSLGYYTYINRMEILENCNQYYVNIAEYIKNLNPLKVYEIINLDNGTVFDITLLNRRFIVPDLNIDINKYKKLQTSMVIPHSPDDILETILINNNNEKIDITDLSKLLIGPFLNQISEPNEKWIFEYLEKKHKYTNINVIELTFINNKKKCLKNKSI